MIRMLAGVILAATFVAACGTAPSPMPSAEPSLAPSAAQTDGAATTAPSRSPDRHADPALEALLPTTLGGVSLVAESQRGTDLTRQSDPLDAMLASLGRTLADFTLASAYSPSGDIEAQAGVWRVAGATAETLLPAFVTAVQASSSTSLSVTELTVGGRAVTRIGDTGELGQGPLYAYAKDDLVLFVQTPDPKLAEEALAEMP